MEIVKTYEHNVSLDINDIYVIDHDAQIIKKLREIFEGRCYKSSLILEILEIKRRSKIYIDPNSDHGKGTVDVVFDARALIYRPGDIIANCEVVRIEKKKSLICRSSYLHIRIDSDAVLRKVREGQIIPAIIKDVDYPKGRNGVSANARMFKQPNNYIIYEVTYEDETNPEESILVIDDIAAKTLELSKQLDSIDKKLSKQIKHVFSGFSPKTVSRSVPKKWKLESDPANFLPKSKPKMIARHPTIDRTTDGFYVVDETSLKTAKLDPFTVEYISMPWSKIVFTFITDQINYLNFIISAIDSYKDKLAENKNIWAIYESLRHG